MPISEYRLKKGSTALKRRSRKGAPFFVLLTIALTFPLTAYAAEHPNMVVIMADDHAQWATGTYGLNEIETPNIDWLAREGVVFENAMSPAPVCSAARASFYTGKMPSQHGVHDFLSEQSEFDADWLAGETLLSERLKDAGYRVGLFGKWHATTDSRPPQSGFDQWLSYDPLGAGWQNQYQHSGTVSFSNNGDVFEYTGVQAHFLTEEAIRFIDDADDRPFFVSLNVVEPHAPFAGLPERLASNYRAVAASITAPGDSSHLPDRGSATRTPEDHVEQFAQYLAAINLIDEQVGRVLDALQGRDLIRNTIVVYTSDHGLLMGQYGLYGKTNATNPPNFYEETIRIPMIVYGANLRSGQRRAELVDLLDLHTTILDFGTGETPRVDYGPGRSLRPLLMGQRSTGWRTLQFAERGNARMASDGRWKLVRYYKRNLDAPPEDHWFDLAHPFGERTTVDGPAAPTRERFERELDRFFDRYQTTEHSGRRIWEQPPPNARMRNDLAANR